MNPKRPIPYAASMVNHISDEMVANEPDFGQVLPEFLTFAGDDILVGHNIQTFDMKFLYRDCERLFQQKLTNDYVDTLRVAKLCFPRVAAQETQRSCRALWNFNERCTQGADRL